jgi:cyclic pyranopterin phosphate synthase
MRNETLSPFDRHAPGAPLADRFGRRITYLRLSVTDRCDFRCTYCMSEEMEFLPRSEVLTLEECLRIVATFVRQGVTKVRITGGEPLVRRDIGWLLERISRLEGVRELVMTTNGSQLERHARSLVEAGVSRLNVSLDTLDAERFRRITRIGDLGKVLRGIETARQAGFRRLKLNTVLIRGGNDDELENLVAFAAERDLDISFIEEMPLGNIGHARSPTFLSADDALARLQARFDLMRSDETTGGPARYWRVPGANTRVGFITPHSHNFCDTCNRVRVTARGELYPCLGHNDSTPLMDILRRHPDDDTALDAAIAETLGNKPLAHDFTTQVDAPKVVRFMSVTGG